MVRFLKKVSGWVRTGYDQTMSLLDSSEDPDRLLSYYTRQQVRFLDRKLGCTFNTLIVCIALYIVGYMFIYQKGYLELEQAKGGVVTHVNGDVLSVSSGKPATRYFSADEITYPGLENGNLFVATRQTVSRQMRGVCADPGVPCSTNTDCTAGGSGYCDTQTGFCVENSWCDQEPKPEIYELDTGSLQIWARSTIQFVKLAPERVFSTESDSHEPRSGYNAFTVRELLMLCKPLPVRYEEVAELGAVIEVQFFWECNVKQKECHPTIKARRLDTVFDPENIGFGFAYPEYIDGDHRIRNEVRGVRLFFRTAGVGKKVSVAATITKASMGAALFSLALIIADLLMTKVFTLKRKYIARKFEKTPDFSDHMKLVESRKKEQVSIEHIEREERAIIEKEDRWMRNLHESDDL